MSKSRNDEMMERDYETAEQTELAKKTTEQRDSVKFLLVKDI